MEEVILVNENDEEIGAMEKLEAHEKALLHRAFSVILFNSKGEMLIQKRASHKYHSPNLWSNACCSHPRIGESTVSAAIRRTQEEIGITPELKFDFKFIYKIEFDNGLTEHELDYVFVGKTDTQPILNPKEVSAFRYIPLGKLNEEIEKSPENFTFWFKKILKKANFGAWTQ